MGRYMINPGGGGGGGLWEPALHPIHWEIMIGTMQVYASPVCECIYCPIPANTQRYYNIASKLWYNVAATKIFTTSIFFNK